MFIIVANRFIPLQLLVISPFSIPLHIPCPSLIRSLLLPLPLPPVTLFPLRLLLPLPLPAHIAIVLSSVPQPTSQKLYQACKSYLGGGGQEMEDVGGNTKEEEEEYLGICDKYSQLGEKIT